MIAVRQWRWLNLARFCKCSIMSLTQRFYCSWPNARFLPHFFSQPFETVCVYRSIGGFPRGSTVKNLPAMQEMWVPSLGWEDLLEEEMATSSSLAWEIPWTEEPGGLQFMGSQTSWTQLSDYRTTKSSIYTCVLCVGLAKKVCCEFLRVRRIYIYYFYILNERVKSDFRQLRILQNSQPWRTCNDHGWYRDLFYWIYVLIKYNC